MFDLFEETRIVKFIDTESRMVAIQDQGGSENKVIV